MFENTPDPSMRPQATFETVIERGERSAFVESVRRDGPKIIIRWIDGGTNEYTEPQAAMNAIYEQEEADGAGPSREPWSLSDVPRDRPLTDAESQAVHLVQQLGETLRTIIREQQGSPGDAEAVQDALGCLGLLQRCLDDLGRPDDLDD